MRRFIGVFTQRSQKSSIRKATPTRTEALAIASLGCLAASARRFGNVLGPERTEILIRAFSRSVTLRYHDEYCLLKGIGVDVVRICLPGIQGHVYL